MDKDGILSCFHKLIKDDPDMSATVAAITTLLKFIEVEKIETLAEMRAVLKDATNTLTQAESSLASISSGCELFLRFITLTSLEHTDFKVIHNILLDRGKVFLQKIATSRQKIAKLVHPFIGDGATILTHSKSRVVLKALKEAAESKKRFNVYITESQIDKSGHDACKELSALGIPSTVILDAAVGYVMEKVDMVLVGAEGVVENGGIINKIGTYTMGIAAKAMNKPFYVVAESFKFVRLYPLNQQDLPDEFKGICLLIIFLVIYVVVPSIKMFITLSALCDPVVHRNSHVSVFVIGTAYQASVLKSKADLSKEHPLVDYTPPGYITLLFTDLGVLTPSAVSDELIKLYC